MIYLAIPSITPRLARCAIDAIRRTTPEMHRVILDMGPGTHGAKLDRMFAGLPSDAEYFFTMDDDAAPLKRGWLSWLLSDFTTDYDCITFGLNAVVGGLYRVEAVRKSLYRFSSSRNPGDAVRGECSWEYRGRDYDLQWWLTGSEAYRDDVGDLVFAHLGGGTIGHTWRHQGKLYPRIPTWLWPVMVRRHLRRQGL